MPARCPDPAALSVFHACGVLEAEMGGAVQGQDVLRHGAGDARHRLALLRAVRHDGAPVAAAPGCTAALP